MNVHRKFLCMEMMMMMIMMMMMMMMMMMRLCGGCCRFAPGRWVLRVEAFYCPTRIQAVHFSCTQRSLNQQNEGETKGWTPTSGER